MSSPTDYLRLSAPKTLGYSSWYLSVTTGVPSATYTVLTANLAQGDVMGNNPRYGSTPTESGGVFSFPDPGLWRITWQAVRYNSGVTVNNYWVCYLDYSSDSGGTWEGHSSNYMGTDGGPPGDVGSCTITRTFEMTANSRVRFGCYTQSQTVSPANLLGAPNRFIFERLT